ncbi:MAG TPA: HAD family hydrolase [Candidatus Limnocylindrales bacterium]|jgi:histidinol-phosphate phosphatase family protein|nr:HAD family hydrolase [Candidatus Limnocylindrales bacterium]
MTRLGHPRTHSLAESSSTRRTVLFVDKDGTLIEDLPYNVDPRRVRFAPGAREAVRLLAAAGVELAVVTNQSGVARGYFSMADLDRLGAHLADEIAALGGRLAGFYACPHLPGGPVAAFATSCDCRKPLPGLLLRAFAELGVDPARSWFVGDTWMDVSAGHAAGCRSILVGPEWRDRSTHPAGIEPDAAVPDLLAAARIVLADEAARSVARGASLAKRPPVGRAASA